LYVEVTGKGMKTRAAPFAIDLVRDRKFKAPGQMFLSFKTKERMQPGTIADLMKNAFNAVGVDGSGHRLRAHYATMMAARLWDECFAMNGYRFDQTVVNLALERLAEAMGHAQVNTTVKHYLDLALLRHFGMANRAKLDAVRSVWDSVVKRQGALSEDKMRLILKVVDGLAAAPDGSDLQQVLAMAVEDPDINPSVARVQKPQARKKPTLRVVRD
jgi:hypothetical protein